MWNFIKKKIYILAKRLVEKDVAIDIFDTLYFGGFDNLKYFKFLKKKYMVKEIKKIENFFYKEAYEWTKGERGNNEDY